MRLLFSRLEALELGFLGLGFKGYVIPFLGARALNHSAAE